MGKQGLHRRADAAASDLCVLLPKQAQEVMGRVHPQTAPALHLLEQEGFRYQGYIDIFDGGPTVEAPLTAIRCVRDSHLFPARRVADDAVSNTGGNLLIANTRLGDFRCALASLSPSEDALELSSELADALAVDDGETAAHNHPLIEEQSQR